MSVTHDNIRDLQARTVSAVVDLLRRDSRILAVSVGGSYAAGSNDAFSDVDMACWLRDEVRTGRPELYERVADLFPLLCKLYVFDRNALYLFTNGVRLDLDFNRPSDVGHFSHPLHRILHDPDGVLANTGPSPKPRPPTPAQHFPNELALVEWFLWMFRQAYCWSKRAE